MPLTLHPQTTHKIKLKYSKVKIQSPAEEEAEARGQMFSTLGQDQFFSASPVVYTRLRPLIRGS